MKVPFTLLALLGLCVTPAPAQTIGLDSRVSLRVEGRALSEVVQYLREQSGANVVVMEGGDEVVSLELTDVPWRDALDLASEAAGCVVEERAAGVLAVTRPKRVSIETQGTDIREVIDLVAKLGGANIVVAPEVTGTLSVRFKDVPWRDALNVAVKTLGYVVVEERRGVLRVVDPVSLQAQMETHSYQLRYLRPDTIYNPRIDSEFLQPIPQLNMQQGQQNVAEQFTVLKALAKALTPGGDMDYIEGRNVIIVRDTAQVHAQITDILTELDIEPPQVFIDVKFVQTSNVDTLDLGVDYGDGGPQISIGMGQIPITLPFELGNGGFEDDIIVNDLGIGPFADPTLNAGGTIIPDTIYGALDFTGIQATLKVIQRDTSAELIQAPKILAVDGREATIFVGETFRYAEAKTEQGQAGGLSLSLEEAENSPVPTGFQLLMTPHVIPGTNMVNLEVIPDETTLSGTGTSQLAPPGFDVFTIGASGLLGSIALPRTRSSTIITTMLLQSGQTAVVGGLSTDQETETISRVPGLSRIPVLGHLFKNKLRDRQRRNLHIFITPTVLHTGGDVEALVLREVERRRVNLRESIDELLFGEDYVPPEDD